MELQISKNEPLIVHVDLNSCFAIIEQQANPLLRHKPVAVAAYDTPRGMVIASSYEAKALGIKLGVNVGEARDIYRGVYVMMPDPEKYFDAHRRFKKVLLNYTSAVTPKSVDEFIVDFRGSPAIREGKSLVDVGYEIKRDIKAALGEYVTVNIGIAPNRFLAKVAAGLNKPDGLDVIRGEDIRKVFEKLTLTDLPGINVRYEARLNANGIWTPLQFLDADSWKLKKQVFHSIVGYYWYMRLRGHEIDDVDFARKSFGRQYAIGQKTADKNELARYLMKLCETAGRRMRKHDYMGSGVHLWLSFENGSYWSKGKKTHAYIYSTQDIFFHASRMLAEIRIPARATNIGVTVYNLRPATPMQLGMFDDSRMDTRALAFAADKINDRYGEFTLVPATMANMKDIILKRVAFGSVKDI